jgi:aldose 1-epimerase
MTIERHAFGNTPSGAAVERFRLINGAVEADILTLGGIVAAVRAPDRDGAPGDVVLGFDTLAEYGQNPAFLGALVGRYGNRIAGGRFTLDGTSYQLAQNDGENHLHGGPGGFSRQIWRAEPSEGPDGPSLQLRYLSASGEEGYPGALDVTVVYTLTADGTLRIDYTATTDQPTIVNLTNHTYFNLAGKGDILGHTLEIPAASYLPTDAGQIPSGELRQVAGTALDFRSARPIGERVGDDDEQLRLAEGYDHTWVLDKPAGQLGLAARVYDPGSGRTLEMQTTEPGVQLYTGNKLDGQMTGHGGQRYVRHAGLCLEAQHFPDSPNQPDFPPTTLRPGEVYRQTTTYRFGVRE